VEPAPDEAGGLQLATGLFDRPTVPAVAPPEPLDRRLVRLGEAAIVLAAAMVTIWWRRRVRP
jgi:hypothetical protein